MEHEKAGDELARLDRIAKSLEVIEMRSISLKRTLLMGVIQGAGVVIGGIIALALISWLLSFLGVIPGFDRFENYLNAVVSDYEHRR